MEMAKEEKSYYSQSLGTYNPKLWGRGHVLQIPTFKAMLIPVSVQTDWYTSHLPYQYHLQGGLSCGLSVPFVTFITPGK